MLHRKVVKPSFDRCFLRVTQPEYVPSFVRRSPTRERQRCINLDTRGIYVSPDNRYAVWKDGNYEAFAGTEKEKEKKRKILRKHRETLEGREGEGNERTRTRTPTRHARRRTHTRQTRGGNKRDGKNEEEQNRRRRMVREKVKEEEKVGKKSSSLRHDL